MVIISNSNRHSESKQTVTNTYINNKKCNKMYKIQQTLLLCHYNYYIATNETTKKILD